MTLDEVAWCSRVPVILILLRDLARFLAEFCGPQMAAHPDEARTLADSMKALADRLQVTDSDGPEKWAFNRGRLVRGWERFAVALADFREVCRAQHEEG